IALNTLRSQIQRDPEIILRYLSGMSAMSEAPTVPDGSEWWNGASTTNGHSRDIRSVDAIQEPAAGDGILTLAEAALLYKAFFPPDEPIDLSNLRRRFLSSG